MKNSALLLVVASLCLMCASSLAQLERYALSNVSLNLGLSGVNAFAGVSYCYYLLTLSAAPSGDSNKLTISGSGTRYDVTADSVVPSAPESVQVNESNSVVQGPVQTHISESTFAKKVGREWLTLTNQTVSEAAFVSIGLSDGGSIKGPFVFTYTRSQKPTSKGVVWKTNESWYGGQLFATYNGLIGSQLIGDD